MLKPYPKYKETPALWLNSIPNHWESHKIRELFVERSEKVSDKDYSPLSVSKAGVVPQIATVAKTNNGDNRKLVIKGDFVINSRSDRRGSSGISNYDGSVSLINIVLKPRSFVNGRYMHYLLKSHYFIEEFYRNGRGIVADLWTTRYTEMKSIYLPVPSIEEQDQIVRFLDWKLAKINKLIQAKKKQIALLTEYRKATIDNVIMYGINPHANRKESGVIWLGEIPSHWSVMKLKRICRINASITSQLEKYSLEDYVVFLPMENISSDGKIDCCEKRKLKDVRNGFSSFAKNDVIVAKITPCFENGKGACLDTLETNIGFGTTELIVLRANEKVLPRYLYMITQLQQFRIEGANVMTGSAGQKRVPSSFISNFELGIPSIAEQSEILEYLDNRLAKFDKLYETLNREIELLTEYRIRLISDVVTGKVDVRDIEIPEYEGDSDETIDGEIDDNIVLEEEGGEMEVE
ncbi:restriction endonuclease subunit S [Thermoanaerobacter sp. X514]|uniref:restriction endonuclease subunit S n=1 Tax=Thermoanaerobacter sp. (strain X514) TaxID=399726 RepID=UPI0000E1E1D6|nr:restriction endonuclease subunit S [Thermoanaerobacter sp. X514]ABY92515.1 restriction modification system DNA specificity domain [Thermoanaerobacter sp. X514]